MFRPYCNAIYSKSPFKRLQVRPIKASKPQCPCVRACVRVCLGPSTYCILHCATLTRTLSSIFPPRRSLSSPFEPEGDGVHSHSAFNLCQRTVTRSKRRQFTMQKPTSATTRLTTETVSPAVLVLVHAKQTLTSQLPPYARVSHPRPRGEAVGNCSVKISSGAFKLNACSVVAVPSFEPTKLTS